MYTVPKWRCFFHPAPRCSTQSQSRYIKTSPSLPFLLPLKLGTFQDPGNLDRLEKAPLTHSLAYQPSSLYQLPISSFERRGSGDRRRASCLSIPRREHFSLSRVFLSSIPHSNGGACFGEGHQTSPTAHSSTAKHTAVAKSPSWDILILTSFPISFPPPSPRLSDSGNTIPTGAKLPVSPFFLSGLRISIEWYVNRRERCAFMVASLAAKLCFCLVSSTIFDAMSRRRRLGLDAILGMGGSGRKVGIVQELREQGRMGMC